MAEKKGMVTGFNHNVKHGGVAYHVQTEDSGVANPRIVTHLFEGGNILATKRIAYDHLLGARDVEKLVRALMEEQHKDMMRALAAGVFDPEAPAGPPPPAGSTEPAPARRPPSAEELDAAILAQLSDPGNRR